jgi:predicted HicB family RNase H-like nuclease
VSEPDPDTRAQLNVSVPVSLKRQIQHLALDQGKTMSDLVTEVLQQYASRQDN